MGNSGLQMRSKASTSYSELQRAGGFSVLMLQPNSSFGLSTYLAEVLLY